MRELMAQAIRAGHKRLHVQVLVLLLSVAAPQRAYAQVEGPRLHAPQHKAPQNSAEVLQGLWEKVLLRHDGSSSSSGLFGDVKELRTEAAGNLSATTMKEIVAVAAGNYTSIATRAEEERRLQSGNFRCHPESLVLMAPLLVADFVQCVLNEYNTRDMTVPGQDEFIYLGCWCSHNMTMVMGAGGLDCCESYDWKYFCNVNCTLKDSPTLNTTCTEEGSRAKNCTEECSSLCLETDYPLMPGCEVCVSDGCFDDYIFCLEWHTQQKLKMGDMDRVCDELRFDRSQEVSEYFKCYGRSPKNTNWQRYNSHSHCMCDANVKKAAEDALCCGHGDNGAVPWAREFCEMDCLSYTDCQAPAAQQCLKHCNSVCFYVDPRRDTPDCYFGCLAADAHCRQYSSCPPLDPEPFSYVCDDGHVADQNGCCWSLLANGDVKEACPLSCSSGRAYHFSHGTQCMCSGCEENQLMVDLKHSGNVSLAQTLYDNGATLLGVIARDAQLPNGWPSQDMADLMRERNQHILDAVAKGDHNQLEVQKKIHRLSRHYQEELYRLARNGGVRSSRDADDDDDDGSKATVRQGVRVWVVVVVLGMTLGVMLIILGLGLHMMRKRIVELAKRTHMDPPQQQPASAGLRDAADPLTIVVGHPINGDSSSPKNTAVGMKFGAAGDPRAGPSASSQSLPLKEAWT